MDQNRSRLIPEWFEVSNRVQDTSDIFTFQLKGKTFDFEPGQFNMLYAFGAGEVPISISGRSANGELIHTIRDVGKVTHNLSNLKVGDKVGLRGPFGRGWPDLSGKVSENQKDILIIAGGLGIAPLRPLIHQVNKHRHPKSKAFLLYGARSPDDLLFEPEIEQLRKQMTVKVTVDAADRSWMGDVGMVSQLLPRCDFDPKNTIVAICGPEIMMRFVALELENIGVSGNEIYLSMERNMKCATGHCGHCQYGADFICRSGPVFTYSQLADRLKLREY